MRHEIFDRDVRGEMVSPNDPGYDLLITDIFDTMKTATEMNTGYRTPEEVHEFMGRILDKPLDKSTTELPPLYIDYGKPVTIGKRCFHPAMLHILQSRRHRNRRRCVYRAESNLITINHDVNPDNRSATYGKPIKIEDKVWLGINATSPRSHARLRHARRRKFSRDKGCTTHDYRRRQSRSNHQED